MNTARMNFGPLLQDVVTSLTNSLLDVLAFPSPPKENPDYLKADLILPNSELTQCFIATNYQKTYISRSRYERCFSHHPLSEYNEIVGGKCVKREYFLGELEILGIKEGENIILEGEIYVMDRPYEGILIGRDLLDEMEADLKIGEEGGILEAEGVYAFVTRANLVDTLMLRQENDYIR
jgi:hypothetical protein